MKKEEEEEEVLATCQQFRKESRKRQTRIMFER